MLDVSDGREERLGKESAEQIIRYYGLVDNIAVTERVENVGKNIAGVCGRQEIEYHFYVLDTSLVNAFALPGGYIFVTRGILDIIDDDDELASILGHEVTHVARKHGITLYKKSIKNAMWNFLLLVLTQDPQAVIAGQMVEQGRTDVFGRKAEIEADRIGLEYMYNAGYEPVAFMSFMKKLERQETHRPGLLEDYYDFHPPMDLRQQLIVENFERLGLEPPEGLKYKISARLVAGEICSAQGDSCYGTIKGSMGELIKLADGGMQGSPYARARKTVDLLNKLLDKKIGLYEVRKKEANGTSELVVRNTTVVKALPEDVEANHAGSSSELVDQWINNIKQFLWNDFLKEEI